MIDLIQKRIKNEKKTSPPKNPIDKNDMGELRVMIFKKMEENQNQDNKGKEDIQKKTHLLSQKAIKNLEISTILFEEWDNKDKRALVEDMAKIYDIDVPIKFVDVIENDNTIISRCSGKIDEDGKYHLMQMEFSTSFKYRPEYESKNADHEFLHAKSDGLKRDYEAFVKLEETCSNNIGTEKTGHIEWSKIEETAVECAAMFQQKYKGLDLAPSYEKHLTSYLPLLKAEFSEFKDFNTISDFGEYFYEMRFGENLNAEWKEYSKILNMDFDFYKYAEQYTEYLNNHKLYIANKIFESYAVDWKMTRSYILSNLNRTLLKYDTGEIAPLNDYEDVHFRKAIAILMEKCGIKEI